MGALRHVDPGVLSHVEIFPADLQDPYAVRALLRGTKAVFHLGALIGIPYSYMAPASYVSVNVGGTLNVLEAARVEGLSRVVITSTSETYGTAQYTPIDEKHPLVAQSPYAATKIAADQLALSYYRSFDLPVLVVRPFNTFGPRQSERSIIPAIVTQALNGDGTIRLGSLAPRRDLTYVTDTASGFLELAERPEIIGQVTNLGTGESRSVREMVDIVSEVVGRTLTVVEDYARLRPDRSEVLELCADASRARALGWRPEVSFREGLRNVIEFFKTFDDAQTRRAGGYRI